ncbi:hypothetical protein FC87_GL000528 [Fructilactobacillus florum DSM 22689 = JCM 16035]|uniref:Uncharacterized protein n=2 Tax=Fructilactobacillus florum TaxID=640331 RepID=A0A0R2CE52_9LACO|nr:hypothetical protein [Fructilactobacillus florum]KRM89346.1 hypothetical protein FC87_GL000528 [Fructilactobacillus florum DSM 22689 = JCM 16035]
MDMEIKNNATELLFLMMNALLESNDLVQSRCFNEKLSDGKTMRHFEFDVLKNTPTKNKGAF